VSYCFFFISSWKHWRFGLVSSICIGALGGFLEADNGQPRGTDRSIPADLAAAATGHSAARAGAAIWRDQPTPVPNGCDLNLAGR
jgi:hypothetical protein